MKEFKDKVAVVTGAASGIGWGLAERCADEGMKVVLADIEGPALQEAAEKLKSRNAEVLPVLTDVSRLSDIEALARKTLDAFGGVHLLFNNAGVQVGRSMTHPVWENTVADWEWALGVNLWGAIYGVNVFLPIMQQQNTPCHIVNTSSMAGLISEPKLVIYSVAKAGIIQLSEALYLQLQERKSLIGVSVLCPAFVHSKLSQAERNRPEKFRNSSESPLSAEMSTFSKKFKEDHGFLTPEQSADIVFRAICSDNFYIFTDPLVSRLFKQRADNILQGRNPERPSII